MSTMPPSPFISATTAERLSADNPGKDHYSAGSFSIDEDSFFYAIDPPPLPPIFISDPSPEYIAAAEIEPLLKILFHRNIS